MPISVYTPLSSPTAVTSKARSSTTNATTVSFSSLSSDANAGLNTPTRASALPNRSQQQFLADIQSQTSSQTAQSGKILPSAPVSALPSFINQSASRGSAATFGLAHYKATDTTISDTLGTTTCGVTMVPLIGPHNPGGGNGTSTTRRVRSIQNQRLVLLLHQVRLQFRHVVRFELWPSVTHLVPDCVAKTHLVNRLFLFIYAYAPVVWPVYTNAPLLSSPQPNRPLCLNTHRYYIFLVWVLNVQAPPWNSLNRRHARHQGFLSIRVLMPPPVLRCRRSSSSCLMIYAVVCKLFFTDHFIQLSF